MNVTISWAGRLGLLLNAALQPLQGSGTRPQVPIMSSLDNTVHNVGPRYRRVFSVTLHAIEFVK